MGPFPWFRPCHVSSFGSGKIYQLSATDMQIDQLFFRNVSVTRNGPKLNIKGVSYSRAGQALKKFLTLIGEDAAQFGFHSLRAGGASQAALVGAPEHLIMLQGRWASDASKDRYLDRTTQARAALAKGLGL